MRWRIHGRAVWALGFMLSIALLCGSAGAWAQTPDLTEQVARLRRELQRTDDLLLRTREELGEADDPKARGLLLDAVESQRRARKDFAQIRLDEAGPATVRQLRQVLRLTLDARDRGVQAGRILREQLGTQALAERSLEQARRKLAQMSEEGLDLSDARSSDVMQRVHEQLDRAERHILDEEFELALRQAQTSLQLMQRLEASGSGTGGRAQLRRELERTEALLRRTSARIEGEESRRRWERAASFHRAAEEALHQGQPALAHARLRECRQLLRDLWSALGVEIDDDLLKRAFARFDQELKRLRDETPSNAPAALNDLLDRAVSERERAQRAFEKNDRERALQHLRAGTDLLARARRRIEGRPR